MERRMKPLRRSTSSREEAGAGLRPGSFQGTLPRGRSHETEDAAIDRIEGQWFATGRYRRRARVTWAEKVTTTRTVRLGLEVVDGGLFEFLPGQFVGVEAHFEGLGYRRSPYCILSPPTGDTRFEILVRVVPQGPLSQRLAELEPGDEVAFRGPNGRSVVPRFHDRELVLLATGTGVAPLLATLGGKHFYLAGNGAMLEEMAQALSDMGVVDKYIYKEPYFDAGHSPDPETVARIRERFVATDLFSAYAARRGSMFDLDRDLDAARSGRAGNGDPLAAPTCSNCSLRSSPTTPTRRILRPRTWSAPGTGRTERAAR
jgi:ferredoxin-NADP reductase